MVVGCKGVCTVLVIGTFMGGCRPSLLDEYDARAVRVQNEFNGWVDLSTLDQPYPKSQEMVALEGRQEATASLYRSAAMLADIEAKRRGLEGFRAELPKVRAALDAHLAIRYAIIDLMDREAKARAEQVHSNHAMIMRRTEVDRRWLEANLEKSRALAAQASRGEFVNAFRHKDGEIRFVSFRK